nr:serine/threonine-protein kinase SMG1-like [Tanacetum cinerariifolium]
MAPRSVDNKLKRVTGISRKGFMARDIGFHNIAGREKEHAVALRVNSQYPTTYSIRLLETICPNHCHTQKNKINAPKYSAMMAPIIVILERRLASTSQKPHEMWSHNEYMGQIKAAISKSSISLGEVSP